MAYTVKISNRFKKQFRLCVKRGLDMNLINEAMRLLAVNEYHSEADTLRNLGADDRVDDAVFHMGKEVK